MARKKLFCNTCFQCPLFQNDQGYCQSKFGKKIKQHRKNVNDKKHPSIERSGRETNQSLQKVETSADFKTCMNSSLDFIFDKLQKLEEAINELKDSHSNNYYFNTEKVEIQTPTLDKLAFCLDTIDIKELSGALNIGTNCGVVVEPGKKDKNGDGKADKKEDKTRVEKKDKIEEKFKDNKKNEGDKKDKKVDKARKQKKVKKARNNKRDKKDMKDKKDKKDMKHKKDKENLTDRYEMGKKDDKLEYHKDIHIDKNENLKNKEKLKKAMEEKLEKKMQRKFDKFEKKIDKCQQEMTEMESKLDKLEKLENTAKDYSENGMNFGI